MAGKYERRRPRRKKKQSWLSLPVVVLLVLAAVLVFHLLQPAESPDPTLNNTQGDPGTSQTTPPTGGADPSTESTAPSTEGTTGPTEPYVVATASVGAAGDVLTHTPVITAAKNGSEYNFDNIYTYVDDYFQAYDYMVVNLEVPLAGPDHPYQGYPQFNCPDSMVDALQKAGVDMVLTANNHSYDMGHDGMIRTQEVLQDKGMDYIGTRTSTDGATYQIQEINGIKIGMVCYTYDTTASTDGKLSLNGLVLRESDRDLVNSFDYTDLDPFYAEIEDLLDAMESDGAEAIMVFLHWGNEYTLTPISYQTTMAQKLCDMGVDVIVGGHPHVLEPFDTLTSDDGHTTYCLYSTGNLISNQRRDTLPSIGNRIYTEDGVIFGVTFQKWSDGTVEVCGVEATPTWVAKESRGSGIRYTIVPLDPEVADWEAAYDLVNYSYLESSYEQTMSILGQGINDAREAFGQSPYDLTLE